MSEPIEKREQNVSLKNRKEIRISGITSVDSFDEYRICATSCDGMGIVVDGLSLAIKEVNLDECFVEAVGDIQGFFYESGIKKTKVGFIKGLFGAK